MKTKLLAVITALLGLASLSAAQNNLTINIAPSQFLSLSNRESSRLFFNSVHEASQGAPMDWTGNYATGNPGTTSAAFKDAVLLRINYFRTMSGVPAGITFDTNLNSKCQQGALMMSVNSGITPNPPTNWLYYTTNGAAALAKSDIALGFCGPDAISAYIYDSGANNTAAGHRSALLFPQTQVMGTGDTPQTNGKNAASVVWTANNNVGTPTPALRDGFIAWPPPGYVPNKVVPIRWSLEIPNANFVNAGVRLVRGGTNMSVSIENRDPAGAESAIVWAINPSATSAEWIMPKPDSDTPIQVTVSNVIVNGVTKSYTYTVTVFDPGTASADTVLPTVTGNTNIVVGTNNPFTFANVPAALSYDWRAALVRPYTTIEGGEQGLSNFDVSASVVAGYAPLVTSDFGNPSGTNYIHLVMPDRSDEMITMKRTIVPSVSSELRFMSKLGYASTQQVATVQVSLDDGVSWINIHEQTGSGGFVVEWSLTNRVVSLVQFANRAIKLRFAYRFVPALEPVSFNTDQWLDTGWSIDDIQVTAAKEIIPTEMHGLDVSTASLAFNPTNADSYALQVRAKVFGNFPAEWGPVKYATATGVWISMNPLQFPGNGKARVSFFATGGHTYRVESITNLSSASWTTVITTNVTTSATVSVDDPLIVGNGGRKFYRAVMTQ